MTNTTTEQSVQIEFPIEEKISLQQLADTWEGFGVCRGVKREDMAYGEFACIGFEGLSKIAQQAQQKYCGPCPLQEACLAGALLNDDIEEGMVGGLTPKARETLGEYVDRESMTVPKAIWDLVINSVLDGEQINLPGGLKRANIPKEIIQSRIMSYLQAAPNNTFMAEKGMNVMDGIAEQVDLPTGPVQTNINALQRQRIISKIMIGKRTRGFSLVA